MGGSTGDVPLDEARLRAAIGPRAHYYLRHWAAMDAKGKSYDWNWAACLLSVFWFAYRKLWGPAIAMGLAYVVTSPFLDPTNKPVFRIVALSLVGLSFLTGSFGNRLYRAKVARIVVETGSEDEAAKRGGVSLPAALIAVLVLVVLSALAGMVPALLAHRG